MSVEVSKVPEYMNACIFCAATIPPEDIVCSRCIGDLRKLYIVQRLAIDPVVKIEDVMKEATERIDKLKLRKRR